MARYLFQASYSSEAWAALDMFEGVLLVEVKKLHHDHT
jgi:hypothetical protein